MNSFRIPSPAKLNLFLHITAQLADGYHELQTIFQLIDLCDYLTFTPRLDSQIHLAGIEEINPQDNLIYRAAQALMPHQKISTGYTIHIEKNIPMGAGLGGGSSNAATTLLVLNKLWQCHLSQHALAAIGAKLGADVPIFIYGQNAWAEGIGERLTPLDDLIPKCYIILKPDCFISTQTLFSQKTLTRNTKRSKFATYQDDPTQFGNNFEPLARNLYPEVEQAFTYLNQYGKAKLTGTGACVFIEINCDANTAPILNKAPFKGYFVKGLNRSPVFEHIQSL